MNQQLTAKERFIQLMTPVVFPLVRLYWFVFRPHTEGVKVIMRDENDQILLVRHAYGSREWTFPGGGKKGDESPEATAKREIDEELSVALQAVQVCGNLTSRKEYKHDHITICTGKVSGKIEPSPFEIDEARWFNTDQVPELESVATKILEVYEQEK